MGVSSAVNVIAEKTSNALYGARKTSAPTAKR